MRGLLVGGLCVLGLALPAAASGATIGVTNQQDETSAANGCSLREAISAANDGNTGPGGDCDPGTTGADVINLPASANPYQVTGSAGDTSNNSGDLNINSDLTISGGGANTTTIQSDEGDRVIRIGSPATSVTIRDVTITGGHAQDASGHESATTSGADSTGGAGRFGEFGGGIAQDSGELTLTRVVVSGNSAGNGSIGGDGGPAGGLGGSSTGGVGGGGGDGGAIETSGGDLTVTDSTIANNQAGNGGAAGAGGGAAPGVSGTTGLPGGDTHGGDGGVGGSGGGIWVALGRTLTLTRSVVQGNGAGSGGAGGGVGVAGPGGDSSTSTAGGTGGCSCGGAGGAGGAGGGIALEPGSSVFTESIIRNNSTGAGGRGHDGGMGGSGGSGTVEQGFGGESAGGSGGSGGDFGGVELRATATNSQSVAKTAIVGNSTGGGGQGADGGTGGLGSTNGESLGGDGGSGGSTAGLGLVEESGSLTNVTLTGNSTGAGGVGGGGGSGPDASQGGHGGSGGDDAGIRVDQLGNATVTHATFAGNSTGSGGSGGGLSPGVTGSHGDMGSSGLGAGVTNQSTGTVTLRNSIVANNDAPNCRFAITDGGHNLSFPASDTSCPAAVVGDPLLGPLQNYGGFTPTLELGAGSPAIDAVPKTGANCALTDQRGVARPQLAACDIGAFEFARPTANIRSPRNGARYRKGAHVLASYGCSEAGRTDLITSCTGTVPNGHAINTSSTGTKAFTVTAIDVTFQLFSKSVHYFVDGSRPTITIKTPKDGATFTKGKKVKASYSCSDIDGHADVKSCKGTVGNGKRINTGKTGKHRFTVVAIDRAGNRTVKTVHYTVKKKKKKK